MSFVAVVLLRRDGVESVVNVLEVKSDNTLGKADAMCIHVASIGMGAIFYW